MADGIPIPTGVERNFAVVRDPPAAIPQPSAEPVWPSERTFEKTPERDASGNANVRRPTSRESAARRNWFSRAPSPSVRRMQISGPTDFRHLQSESFRFPPRPQESRPRPSSFQPIELSIYRPENRLSAILPHIECNVTTPPPRAHTGNRSNREDSYDSSTAPAQEAAFAHERSRSATHFRLPRKASGQMSEASASPPEIPPKSRARAATAPNTGRIVERIASAMMEKERLQAEINSLAERQSLLYLNSRPSTGHDMRGLEPMPSIPALPAAAPSFAERLSTDDRPRTAPSRVHGAAPHEKTAEPSGSARSSPRQRHGRSAARNRYGDPSADFPLAPPLPLVLRPPLRKKKSFSRVSRWLFNPDGGAGAGSGSSAAVSGHATTSPRPVKASDGFYQCVAPPEGLPRTSMDASSSVYTWETGGDADADPNGGGGGGGGARTLPTTATTTTATSSSWSPDQTPKQGWSSSTRHTTPVLGESGFSERGACASKGAGVAVADEEREGLGVDDAANANRRRPLSVGVAF
ncbi:hypothetical protein VTH06DRAFT_2955 [Thermothelomyces fergusii]